MFQPRCRGGARLNDNSPTPHSAVGSAPKSFWLTKKREKCRFNDHATFIVRFLFLSTI